MKGLIEFLQESNAIEGKSTVTSQEFSEAKGFLSLEAPGIEDLCSYTCVARPGAILRKHPGMDVLVGTYKPPPGGPEIPHRLSTLLGLVSRGLITPYAAHAKYETLHPFTGGNGRSGRLLWLWQMVHLHGALPPLGFLHTWYYQSLQGSRA